MAYGYLVVLLALETVVSLISYRDLRYIEVIGQTDWYTCGPAAVATLLTHYYGIPTTEAETLELAEEFMREMGLEPGPERGVNALALKKTIEAKGITTKGYRVEPEDLRDYFARGGLPVIVHLTLPKKHFVVAVGMVGDQIVLADPSWGRSIIPFSSFVEERGYSGVVLVPIPPPELVPRIRSNQWATLSWARGRLSALIRLREELP
ncbi:C39 family peptidase [Candidatus Bipolaricaulota sp. J31]